MLSAYNRDIGHVSRIITYLEQNQPDAALTEVQQITDPNLKAEWLKKCDEHYLILAQSLLKNNDPIEALASVKKISDMSIRTVQIRAISPLCDQYYIALAEVSFAKGQLLEALKYAGKISKNIFPPSCVLTIDTAAQQQVEKIIRKIGVTETELTEATNLASAIVHEEMRMESIKKITPIKEAYYAKQAKAISAKYSALDKVTALYSGSSNEDLRYLYLVHQYLKEYKPEVAVVCARSIQDSSRKYAAIRACGYSQ